MSKENPGKWLPCGCREDVKSKKLVRICPTHQQELAEKEAAKAAKK